MDQKKCLISPMVYLSFLCSYIIYLSYAALLSMDHLLHSYYYIVPVLQFTLDIQGDWGINCMLTEFACIFRNNIVYSLRFFCALPRPKYRGRVFKKGYVWPVVANLFWYAWCFPCLCAWWGWQLLWNLREFVLELWYSLVVVSNSNTLCCQSLYWWSRCISWKKVLFTWICDSCFYLKFIYFHFNTK